jgi:transcriptional regulator with XRE-family HTH domain
MSVIMGIERRPPVPTLTPRQINADKLRTLREETGKGRTEVAFLAGITDQTLRFWERGKQHRREPRIESVKRLADTLSTLLGRKITPSDLFKPETPTEETPASAA